MAQIDFTQQIHSSTKRDYLQRVIDFDKADCAVIGRQWGKDYWDGERQYGYGGYSYDGRWLPIAQDIADHYGLKANDRILDIGCGKAYLLFEFTQAVPGIGVAGLDISEYAIENAKEEVKPFLEIGDAASDLPWEDNTFDFVYSITTLHNLRVFELKKAVQEMERVGKGNKWMCVESYRNEREKANMLYWQVTCASFYDTDEWAWILKEWGYQGDYGFIYFD
jgi:SAM-dependent methyltransferase